MGGAVVGRLGSGVSVGVIRTTMHQRGTVLRYLCAWGTSLDSRFHPPERPSRKRRSKPVSQQQTSPSDPASQCQQSSAPSSDFGANEWLVEEMYEQFQRDPGSVDPSWAAYFKTNGNGAAGQSGNGASPPTASAPASAPGQHAQPARPAKAPASAPASAPARRRPQGRACC